MALSALLLCGCSAQITIDEAPAKATAWTPKPLPDSIVQDLWVDSGDVSPYYLHWTYRNPGDLDQNSEVNINDLSVLGASLSHYSDEPDWAKYSRADANGDGAATVGDLSMLGRDYMTRVEGYVVEYSPDESVWDELSRVTLAEATPFPGNRVGRFDFLIEVNPFAYSFRVRPFRGDALGYPSEPVRGYSPVFASGLYATQGTEANWVILSWSNPDDCYVVVQRADAPEGPYKDISVDFVNTDFYYDRDVVSGRHYWYQLHCWVFASQADTCTGTEGWSALP